LSIAARLRYEGVDFRIFGTPMHRWQAHMPKGMFLKTEGCASNLFDPTGSYTLRQYCAEKGLPYARWATPVRLDVFTQYGLSFQRRFVPTVEDVMVTALDRSSAAFELRLASGETLRARKVVVATGLCHTAYVPPELTQLPRELLSHSSRHHDLGGFKGRDVTVVGGGQSALETAALLHEAGAEVRVLARRSSIVWNPMPTLRHRSLYERLRRPMSNLGPGLGPWLYSHCPMLFRHLPQPVRIARVRKSFGPAGAGWLRHRVEGRLPVLLGHSVRNVETRGDQVLLHLEGPEGKLRQLTTDHLIAATGYRFALGCLPFLSQRLLSQLRSVRQTPVLSADFESSVPGLYFTGLASANQFGPVMRFLEGADYTARRVCPHIAGNGNRVRFALPAVPSRTPKCEEV
jgi:hypothetical protein